MNRIKTPKQILSYANTVKTPKILKTEEIPIVGWLKYWGLEKFYKSLFVNTFTVPIRAMGTVTVTVYKYDALLKKIKTNIDLLFSFHSIENFISIINPIIYYTLYTDANGNSRKIDSFESDVQKYISIFYSKYSILFNQKRDYKEYLSILGLKSKKKDYIDLIDGSDMLDFLDQSVYKDKLIFKHEIILKLKMISFDDMLNSDRQSLRLFLSVPIELCELFLTHTKDKINMTHPLHHLNIKAGFAESMSDTQFKRKIEKNTNNLLKMFESCDNSFDIKRIKEMIIQNYDAESFINSSRMDLLKVLISPNKLILNDVSNNIYNYIFPDNDSKFIESQFKAIPRIIPISEDVNTKYRVFFIQAHGAPCKLDVYKKKRSC